jgi:hypothetical protein
MSPEAMADGPMRVSDHAAARMVERRIAPEAVAAVRRLGVPGPPRDGDWPAWALPAAAVRADESLRTLERLRCAWDGAGVLVTAFWAGGEAGRRAALAESALPRAATIARRMARGVPRLRDDAAAAARLGVAAAVAAFDPRRPGAEWPRLANAVVRHHVLRLLRDEEIPRGYRQPRCAEGRHAVPGAAPGVSTAIVAVPSGELPVGWGLEYEDFVEGLARRVPGRQAEALRLHYLSAACADWVGLGVAMGLRDHAARNHHNRAVAEVRRQLRAERRRAMGT